MRNGRAPIGDSQGKGRFIGACDCEEPDCEDLQLGPADLVVWEVDLAKLGRAVVKALEMNGRDAPVGVPGVRQIGAFGPAGMPVVLVVHPGAGGLVGVAAHLVARLKGRFVLLAPTGRLLDAECQGLLASVGARFFDLESQLDLMPSGRLAARKKAAQLFAPLLPEESQEISDDELRKIYGLVLLTAKDQKGSREGPIKDVFDLYCLKALSPEEVAVKLGCSKTTVMNRLANLKKLAGVPAKDLRAYKPSFEQIEKELTDPRARRLRRKDAAYGDDPPDADE